MHSGDLAGIDEKGLVYFVGRKKDMIRRSGEEVMAYFKVPGYRTYRDELPRTPSERVRKEVLKGEVDDPRVGAYDRVDAVWR